MALMVVAGSPVGYALLPFFKRNDVGHLRHTLVEIACIQPTSVNHFIEGAELRSCKLSG